MKRQSLPIQSNDGAKIEATLYQPDTTSSDILFLCLPAMGVKASYYQTVAEALTGLGHCVLLCDLRGQGTSNCKASKAKFGYQEMVETDLPAYVKAANTQCPQKKVILLGHSLGGHLGLLYMASHPDVVTAVALIASGSVYYRAYPFPQNVKIWFGTQSAVLISTLFGYFPGHKLGFGGRQPKAVIRDWARQGRTGRFEIKSSDVNYETGLAKITQPVFALSLEGDDFAPHSAMDHLVGKLKSAPISRVKYTSSEALKPKINHFTWVKQSGGIVKSLNHWLTTL